MDVVVMAEVVGIVNVFHDDNKACGNAYDNFYCFKTQSIKRGNIKKQLYVTIQNRKRIVNTY